MGCYPNTNAAVQTLRPTVATRYSIAPSTSSTGSVAKLAAEFTRGVGDHQLASVQQRAACDMG